MNFTALLLSLGLMGTACSCPVCEPNCKLVKEYHTPDFKHVSELQDSSVAPWSMSVDQRAGREPSLIPYANCKNCTEKHMTAKPIFLQVSVYHRIPNCHRPTWCQCPFQLAVGCTCVKHQDKS